MTDEDVLGRQWMTVSEWRKRYPYLGKNKVYKAVGDGTLKSVKIGGKILIASDALDQLADNGLA